VVLDVTLARAADLFEAPRGLGRGRDRGRAAVSHGEMSSPAHGPDFQNLHRNSARSTLTSKSDAGHAVFAKLAKRAAFLVKHAAAVRAA